ncbi:hypothetical protein L596_009348 [Steinernema carpocapsae]|uniref:TOG domain-containing protein n=1 Tax=Steinernema carpocapsae TaxID=34508 RepID=A0A4U5PFD3_STECR|nr:hypothetical protein L596_009348 [Steinernema carpocapsae]
MSICTLKAEIASVVFKFGPEAVALPSLLDELPEREREVFVEAISLTQDLKKAENSENEDNVLEIRELLARIFKRSNDPGYRDALCQLGLVELLKSLVVSDVGKFGLEKPLQKDEKEGSQERLAEEKTMKDHGEMRKAVAKILIDLTYGSVENKRRLCVEGRFIPTTVQIVNSCRGAVENLAFYYASLLRNLSWQVDQELHAVLAPAVTALCCASVRALEEKDARSLSATLSAVFNLSGHSNENRQDIIENDGFMQSCMHVLHPKMAAAKIVLGIFENLGKFLRTTTTQADPFRGQVTSANYDRYRGQIMKLQLIPRVLGILEKTENGEMVKRSLRILNFLADVDRMIEVNAKSSQAVQKIAQRSDEELANLAKGILMKPSFGRVQRGNMSNRFAQPKKPPPKPTYVLPHEQVDPNTSILVQRNPMESLNVSGNENISFNSSIHTDVNSIPLSPESCSNLPPSPVSGGEQWARQQSSGYYSSSTPSTLRNSPVMSKTSSDWTRANSQMSR